MRSYEERARIFGALHQRPGLFIVANPWDAGTARLFAGLGFEALATTSFGLANSLGRRDGQLAVSRHEAIAHCRAIATATDLPLHADLENGYADAPAGVAETIRLAADAGAVGGLIEDATGKPAKPIYEFNLAVERIHAAAEAAHSLPVPFMLTARADNYLRGSRDLDDTIRRLQAYEKAGADVLYVAQIPDLATVRAVLGAVRKPLNVSLGGIDASVTVAELEEAGVKRLSTSSSMARVAVTAIIAAARELKEQGTVTFLRDLVSPSVLWEAYAEHAS
jgi:2-methylisocitrate lyase-like PEP mutase family enzyme